MESRVRTINGIDYVVVNGPEGPLYIQDFIRFPERIIVPGLQEVKAGRPHGSGSDDAIIRNHNHKDASGACGWKANVAVISASPGCARVGLKTAAPEGMAVIGIHRGITDPLCTHALVADPAGHMCSQVIAAKNLPTGIVRADTSHLLVEAWARKAAVGLFKLPSGNYDFVSAALPQVSTELFAMDCCGGAMHAAFSLLGCTRIILAEADLTFVQDTPGCVPAGNGRNCFSQQLWTLDYIAAVAHVFKRNGGVVCAIEGTMGALEGVPVIDTKTVKHAAVKKHTRKD